MDDLSKQLQKLLESDLFTEVRAENKAKSLRGESPWFDNFIKSYAKHENVTSSHLINAKTGRVHTVESMVEELRERVKLDQLSKHAGLSDEVFSSLALSVKQAEAQDLDNKCQVIVQNFLSAHNGYADNQAVIYVLKDRLGDDYVSQNLTKIEKCIEDCKKEFDLKEKEIPEGSPEPLKMDPALENRNIFESIEKNIGK